MTIDINRDNLTADQLIAGVRDSLDVPHVRTVLDACEALNLSGFSDDTGGDAADGRIGYFYRVDRWIVGIDSQGFKNLTTYPDVETARSAFWDNILPMSDDDEEMDR